MDAPSGPLLRDWPGWHLETRCRCRAVFHPTKLLAQAHGERARLADIARRLRCAKCGERPSCAMVDDPARGSEGRGGGPAQIRVPLP